MEDAAVFIDGFNLYHGICDADLRSWLWVDLWKLARVLVPKAMHVSEVNYYTAHVTEGSRRARQGAFLEANRELNPGLKIVAGFMQKDDCCTCRHCGTTSRRWNEKRTDVNMAVDIVTGATAQPKPRFDLALLVTGDADQVAAVNVVKGEGLNVLVRMPPNRPSAHLTQAAGGPSNAYHITANQLRQAQMPETVIRAGYPIKRPTEWGIPS